MDTVTVKEQSESIRTYKFEGIMPTSSDFDWLSKSQHIKSYRLEGDTLYVTKATSMDWPSVQNNVILPGIKKAFGQLKVKDEVFASRA